MWRTEMMGFGRLVLVLYVACAAILAAVVCFCAGFKRGQSATFEEGHRAGREEGYADGHRVGFQEGLGVGKDTITGLRQEIEVGSRFRTIGTRGGS